MLRANRPWRLAAHLHRSLFAAFAVSAYALVTPDVWRIADSLAPLRLAALSVAAAAGTVVSLIARTSVVGAQPVARVSAAGRSVQPGNRADGGLRGPRALCRAVRGLVRRRAAVANADGARGRPSSPCQIPDDLKVVWLAASLATTGARSARPSSQTAPSARPRTRTAPRGLGRGPTQPAVRRGRTDVSAQMASGDVLGYGAWRRIGPS